jgi:hypothetical protein
MRQLIALCTLATIVSTWAGPPPGEAIPNRSQSVREGVSGVPDFRLPGLPQEEEQVDARPVERLVEGGQHALPVPDGFDGDVPRVVHRVAGGAEDR